MKKLISILLSVLILVGIVPFSIFAETIDIKEATVDVFSSEFGYGTCKLYLNGDKWLMDISDIAKYTRTSAVINGKKVVLSHGTRKISINMENGNLSEDGINFDIKTYQFDDKNLIHAFPILSYLGAECDIKENRFVIKMPQSTIWEGLVRSSNENYFTLETFGGKSEQNRRLFLNAVLKILESGLSSLLVDNAMKDAIVEVMQVDPLKYDGAWDIKEATDEKYGSLISAMIATNDFATNSNEILNDTNKIANVAIDYLKVNNEDDILFTLELDQYKALFKTVSTATSFFSNLSVNSKCTKDSFAMLEAFMKHTTRKSYYYDAANDVKMKVESEWTSTLDSALDIARNKMADEYVKRLYKKLTSGKKGYTSVTKFLESSVNISVILHKLIYGENNAFAYASAETNAINMLMLKNELLKDIEVLGKKIISENYTNAQDIDDYRLLNAFYYRTLIAANEQLEDMIVAQGRENEEDMKDLISDLHDNNDIFVKNLYHLTVSKGEKFTDVKKLSKSNVWDSFEKPKNEVEEENEENVDISGIVVDAVKYEKNIIPVEGLEDMGYEKYKHKVILPKITKDSKNATAFNKKIYNQFSGVIEILKNNQEYARMYDIDYEYKTHKKILGITVINSSCIQAGGGDSRYYTYYYDLENDCEITFSKYLSKFGFDKTSIMNLIKKSSEYATEFDYVYDQSHVTLKDCIIGDKEMIVVFNNSESMDGYSMLKMKSVIK